MPSERCGTGWCCSGHCCPACAGAWAQACRVWQKVALEPQFLFFPQSPERLCYIHSSSSSDWCISLIPPQQPIPKHLPCLCLLVPATLPERTAILLSNLQGAHPGIVSVSLHAIYGYYSHNSATRTSLRKAMPLGKLFSSSKQKHMG